MDREFWQSKWRKNEIGFHNADTHPLLTAHFAELGLSRGARVYVPLCGKTRDIAWLLGQGFQVVASELSELAIEQLFAELNVAPTMQMAGDFQHYAAPMLDVFVGDALALPQALLGTVDAIYDRAALVALPEDMRTRYAVQLIGTTDAAPQLLICFDYDQSIMTGPPFSIPDVEVGRLYQATYKPAKLAQRDVRFKDQPAFETVWHLT